jgi:Rrf2 family protein
MAIISTKGEYGLRAILILAKEDTNKLLQIKEIALKGDIPSNYLEQILVTLKRNGFVESIRGANGGYKLAKEKSEIKVYDVLSALDCCVSFADKKIQNSMLEPFWEDIQKKVQEIFNLSIKELEEFLQNSSSSLVYHI